MSLYFSITIMIRAIRMFNAATSWMESDRDDGHHFFHLQGVQDRPILLHPGCGCESRSDDAVCRCRNFRGLVDLSHPKFDGIHDILDVEQHLRR